ncbi:hypothetical protein [Streptomyces sp. NPDC091027]|uniref:hypothetical protein n=1 Tax=Streptomyces sp. NPDC091027 TaxID=3365971 RepID=UPI0037FF01D8
MSPNHPHPLRPGEPLLEGLTILILVIVILAARPGPELGATCALLVAAATARRRLA